MTQQDALCRAVCEHPDEDVPRLIFADHLEERGEVRRAAFIRTQVELGRLPEHDPLWVRCRLRDPDAIRGWTMAHTLPALPRGASWRRFQFRRGFPWLASATSLEELMLNGDRLFERAPIQALHLDHDCGLEMRRFAEWPHLAKLTRLEFTHTNLSADAIRRLCRSPFAVRLRELSFDGHAISAEGLRELAESELFSRLRRLELHNAALAPALATAALAAAPPGLRELSLADCKLPGTDAAWLLNQSMAKNLVHLDLSGNPIRNTPINRCAELEVLRLRQTSLGVEGVQALAAFRERDETSPHIPPLPSGERVKSGLRMLDLSANRLGPASVSLLVGSSLELVELDVRTCGFDLRSLQQLKSRFGEALRADPSSLHNRTCG